MPQPPHIEVSAFCHRGAVRDSNEDTITVGGWVSDPEMSGPRRARLALDEPLLVAVADGMGGHVAGEVASRYAIKRLAAARMKADPDDIAARLAAINAELYQTMGSVPAVLGMGTTVAGLLLTATRAVWFNVGDSRVYGERAGRFELLSIDDVPPGPRSGMITQTLGGFCTFVPIEPHMGAKELLLPSRWLICSDGLTDMVDDRDIERALAASDEEAVCTLFDLAMRAGGADNVSIIVVRASTSS